MRVADIVLTIPHASSYIPPEIRSLIPHADAVLNRSPDLYTERLYDVPGVRTVLSRVSRIIADVNRAPDEMYTEGRRRAEGVVSLSLPTGIDVFAEDPSWETMQGWINAHHAPFHEELDRALEGMRFLIDCHSMWSVAPPSRPDAGTPRPDIVIGNRLYTTCDARTTRFMRDFWMREGYNVAVNDPYIGRYVVGTHCSRKTMPGVQIELKRSLYMDEVSLEPNEVSIARFNGQFRAFVASFSAWDEKRSPKEKVHICDLSPH